MSEIESLVVFDEPLDFETCNRIASKFMGQIVDFNAPYEPSEDEELIHLYLIAIENKRSKIIDTYNLENIQQVKLTAHGYTPPPPPHFNAI